MREASPGAMPWRRAAWPLAGVVLAAVLLAATDRVAAASAAEAGEGIALLPRSAPLALEERASEAALASGQRVALRTATWLGRLATDGRWTDFRGQRVPAGEYELCYMLQPRLKEHVGHDAHRDFAVLVPAPRQGGDRACAGDWLGAARAVTATGHPAVLALLPAADADELASREPEWRLRRASVGGLDLALVVRGQAGSPEEAF